MASGCWGDTVEMADPKNAGVRGGPTRNGLHLHVPLCRRLRQFRLGTSPFEEQANAVGADGRPGPLRAPFAVTPRETTEMNELALNLPLLEELAAKSGGKVFTPETSAGLAELLKQRQATRTERTEMKLWRSWPTLLLFVALLTLEWAGRKWAGLP